MRTPPFWSRSTGDPGTVMAVAVAIQNPVWPPFLGRKSWPPTAPLFAGLGLFDDLIAALRFHPWRPRLDGIDSMLDPLKAVVEVAPEGGRILPVAWPVQDVPVSFTHRVYGTRFVQEVELEGVEHGGPEFTEPPRPERRPATSYPGWSKKEIKEGEPKGRREQRLDHDHGLCVFCKSPAQGRSPRHL